MKNKVIGVIGLGYVGLPLAVEFGKVRSVIGFDVNNERIADLNAGHDNTLEVSADDLKKATFLEYTNNPLKLKKCSIYIVTVPTPIDRANRPNLEPLVNASEIVGQHLSHGDIVIYESTVYPGCTEEVCVPVLEKTSGLIFNKDFFCGYSPERINPGDKVNTLKKIKKITSGSTPIIADEVDDLYNQIIDAGTHRAESIKVAEAAKVIENTQRDLNIAFVNELSIIFDRLNIDTNEVLAAAGSKWNFLPFRPGMVGGHCIGVDPYYLTHKAEEVGYLPQVILAGRRINDNMSRYIARHTIRMMIRGGIDVSQGIVGVLGITFKENCPDVRNSKVIDLIDELKSWGIKVVVSDPWANSKDVMSSYGISLVNIETIQNVDALIVAVAHAEYRVMDLLDIKSRIKGDSPILIDVKGLYDRHESSRLNMKTFRL